MGLQAQRGLQRYSGVAQWQSGELLTRWPVVRTHPSERRNCRRFESCPGANDTIGGLGSSVAEHPQGGGRGFDHRPATLVWSVAQRQSAPFVFVAQWKSAVLRMRKSKVRILPGTPCRSSSAEERRPPESEAESSILSCGTTGQPACEGYSPVVCWQADSVLGRDSVGSIPARGAMYAASSIGRTSGFGSDGSWFEPRVACHVERY